MSSASIHPQRLVRIDHEVLQEYDLHLFDRRPCFTPQYSCTDTEYCLFCNESSVRLPRVMNLPRVRIFPITFNIFRINSYRPLQERMRLNMTRVTPESIEVHTKRLPDWLCYITSKCSRRIFLCLVQPHLNSQLKILKRAGDILRGERGDGEIEVTFPNWR